jgi:hypothetical protein
LGVFGQVLVAAHDVGDAHLDVVDDVGEDEQRRAVGAGDREVLHRALGNSTLPRTWSSDDCDALIGGAEPDGALGPAEVAAVAVVTRLESPVRAITSSRVQVQR